ncbi:MAG TPA: aldo/keto reductase [Actinomycetes bacterium]|nr:aldo/keto reductase [Actinomycetes bacterium]
MKPRPLGSTGLQVTPVGLGLAALGRPAYIDLGRDADLGDDRGVEALERRCHEVLDAAFAAGVRYLDAARSYGLAEAFLASWLQGSWLDPAEVTVGSKWGYTYVGDWRMDAEVHEVKDHSLAALARQVRESRELLGDHLDLYQVHSATLDSGVLSDRAVLDELARLRDDGLVIGLSSSGPGQAATIRRALEVTRGAGPFACVQATWNLLEPSAGPALAEASAAGWGVIVKEAVANGRLTPHGHDHGHGPAAVLERVAAGHGVGVDAVALAAVLANPWADVVLSGAVTRAQLEANLAAVGVELTPGDLEELAALAEPPERYWEERSALSWS